MISEHSDSISRGPAYSFIRFPLPNRFQIASLEVPKPLPPRGAQKHTKSLPRSAGHVQGRQHLALKALAHLVTIAVPPDHERIAVRRTAAAIDRAVRNARLIFVQDFWHTTRIPASLARRTMSAVPRPPGNASTRSGLPSSSICWLRLGPRERPKSTR